MADVERPAAGPREAEHTPGPWRYQEGADKYTHIVRAGNRFIVQLSQDTSGVAEANARLIAAAPELLEALVEVLNLPENTTATAWVYRRQVVDRARAAIAKARARTNEVRTP